MGVFHLKKRDTRPILEVALEEPDPLNPGAMRPFSLVGSTAYKLHILLPDDSKLIRDMVPVGADEDGVLQYAWIPTDWDPASGGGAVGGLVVGPTIPLQPDEREIRMEYEVIGGSSRITFPNDGYDTLRILDDIGNG